MILRKKLILSILLMCSILCASPVYCIGMEMDGKILTGTTEDVPEDCEIKNLEMQAGSTLIVRGNLIIKPSGKLILNDNIKIYVFGDFIDYNNGKSSDLMTSKSLVVIGGKYIQGKNSLYGDEIYVFLKTESQNYDTGDKFLQKYPNDEIVQIMLLPIEITIFAVAKTNELNLKFYWKTESESPNEVYTLQFSTNGKHFEEISEISCYGTASFGHEYTYEWTPNSGFCLYYFRLKQKGANNEYTCSKIISFNLKRDNISGIYFQNGKIMYSGGILRI